MSIRRFLVVVGRVPAAALSHVDITLLKFDKGAVVRVLFV